MGRELKRVSLDFNWPLNKVWGGFINPFYQQSVDCPDCKGTGSSKEVQHLTDLWYGNIPFRPEDNGSVPFTTSNPAIRRFAKRNCESAPDYYGSNERSIEREARRLCSLFNSEWMYHLNDADVAALVAADRLRDFTHTWTPEGKWQKKEPPYIPTAREVNEGSIGGGFSSPEGWPIFKVLCEKNGWLEDCLRCNGEGSLWPTPEIKKACDDWEATEPPVGEGFQMWETTSEGSPISPVFETAEKLAHWLADNNASAFGGDGASYETWLAMIGRGWAPSAVFTSDKGLRSGVEAVADDASKKKEITP